MAINVPNFFGSSGPINSNNVPISSRGIGVISASNTMSQPTHAIQGKMMTTKYILSDVEYTNKMWTPEEVKNKLMEDLVKTLFNEKCIEFTKMTDPATGEHRFHARIFVVPDTQVRILRENKVATSQSW